MPFKDSIAADAADNISNGEDVEATIANRPHDQAFVNTDQLASVFNADRGMLIRGGGTVTWNTGTETLTFGSTIYISYPNENISAGVGGAVEHTITSGSLDFSAGGSSRKNIAAIKLSRTAEPGYAMANVAMYISMTELESTIAAEGDPTARFDYVIIAKREPTSLPPDPNDHIILWDGRRVRSGESIINAGATDSQYAQDADFQAKRVDENQDRNMFLLGGGTITWEGPGYGLKIADDLYLSLPNNVMLQIPAGTFSAITNDECYVLYLGGNPGVDRADDAVGPLTVTPRTLDHADVDSDNDDLVILAVVLSSRLHLMDGTVVEDGFKTRLGGLAQGVRWVYSGPGTGVALYDFDSVGGSIIRPTGATPEYYPGATELHLFVNGLRYTEGRFGHPSGATNADYDEPNTPSALATTVTFTPSASRPVPTASDWVVAFVGLATPNLGPTGLDQLSFANSAGAEIASVDLSTDDVREDDATNPTVKFSSIASGAEIAVGAVIDDPVSGRRAQDVPGIDHGALLAFSQRPQVFYDDTDGSGDSFIVSPGELPIPLTASRETWVVQRAWQPVQKNGGPAAPPSAPGGLVYVYVDLGGTTHDSEIDASAIVLSTTAPQRQINTYTRWMSLSTNEELVYIGCFWAYTTAGPVFDYIRAFDRVGDEVRYRADNQPEILNSDNGGGGWGGSGGTILATGMGGYVPPTAHGAILQVQFDVDMSAYDTGGGTDITGVAFYGDQSTPHGTFPSSIADAHDVQYLVQPLGASASGTMRFAYAPFILPVNDLTGGIPDDPTMDIWVGPYVAEIIVHVVGFVESQQHMYRHR